MLRIAHPESLRIEFAQSCLMYFVFAFRAYSDDPLLPLAKRRGNFLAAVQPMADDCFVAT